MRAGKANGRPCGSGKEAETSLETLQGRRPLVRCRLRISCPRRTRAQDLSVAGIYLGATRHSRENRDEKEDAAIPLRRRRNDDRRAARPAGRLRWDGGREELERRGVPVQDHDLSPHTFDEEPV